MLSSRAPIVTAVKSSRAEKPNTTPNERASVRSAGTIVACGFRELSCTARTPGQSLPPFTPPLFILQLTLGIADCSRGLVTLRDRAIVFRMASATARPALLAVAAVLVLLHGAAAVGVSGSYAPRRGDAAAHQTAEDREERGLPRRGRAPHYLLAQMAEQVAPVLRQQQLALSKIDRAAATKARAKRGRGAVEAALSEGGGDGEEGWLQAKDKEGLPVLVIIFLVLGFVCMTVGAIFALVMAVSYDGDSDLRSTGPVYYYIIFFVASVSALVYYSMWSETGVMHVADGDVVRIVFPARYLDWAVTSPLMLVGLGLLGNASLPSILGMVGCDLVMIGCLYTSSIYAPVHKYFWFGVAVVFFLVLVSTSRKKHADIHICMHTFIDTHIDIYTHTYRFS